jgi:hypothetical protein
MLWSEALSRKPCFRTQLIGTISSDWASQTSFTYACEYILDLIFHMLGTVLYQLKFKIVYL